MGRTNRQPDENDRTANGAGQPGGQGEEIAPFAADEFAGGASAPKPSGQFSGEEIEFESFMFDKGDTEGLNLPSTATDAASSTTAEEPAPAITGESVPVPDLAAFAGQVEQPVSDAPEAGEAVSVPAVPQSAPTPRAHVEPLALDDYPGSAAGWTDQLLGRVENFWGVLVALRAGRKGAEPVAEASAAPAPVAVVEQAPVVEPAPAEAQAQVMREVEQAPAPEAAPEVEEAPVGEAVPPAVVAAVAAAAAAAPPAAPEEQAPAEAQPARDETPAAPVVEAPAQLQEEQPQPPEISSTGAETEEGLPPWLEAAAEQEAEPAPAEQMQESAPQEAAENLPPWLEEEVAAPAREPAFEAAAQPEAAPQFEPVPQFEPETYAEQAAAAPEEAPPAVWQEGGEATAQAGPAEDAEGRFSGEALEFESFMFDKGATPPLPALPNYGQMMPSVQAMESEVAPPPVAGYAGHMADEAAYARSQAAAEAETLQMPPVVPMDAADYMNAQPVAGIEADEVLPVPGETALPEDVPFWLADESRAPSDHMAATTTAEQSPTYARPAPVRAPEAEEDFAELPPIEPFDFSAMGLNTEKDDFGFSTEELTGYGARDEPNSMTITADLDVVAGLLGKDRTSGALGRGMVGSETSGQMVDQLLQHPEQAGHAAEAEEPGGEAPEWGAPAPDTGALAASAVTQPEEVVFHAPTEPREAQYEEGNEPTMQLSDGDMDVTPFDVSSLDLGEADETSTEFLDAEAMSRDDEMPLPPKVFTDTLFTRPNMRMPDYWEAPRWMEEGEGEEGRETERLPVQTERTGAEAGVALEGQGAPGAAAWQTMEESIEAQDAQFESSLPEDVFKVRVSRFKPGGSGLLSSDAQHTSGVLEQQDVASFGGAQAPAPVDMGMTIGPAGDFMPTVKLVPEPVAPAREGFAPAREQTYTEDEYQMDDLGAASYTPRPEPEPATALPPQVYTSAPAAAPMPPAASTTAAAPAPSAVNNPPTGPLPPLEGFHELQDIVASRPNDLGAHMALAVAYSQAGHMEHAIHEYSRLLQKRTVSLTMLQLIDDQLGDIEEEAGSLARFHKLRGDLYMRQSRYQDAIEEYNKLA